MCPPHGGGSGVPSPQSPQLGGSDVPSPWGSVSPLRVWCALSPEGLVCPPQGGFGVPWSVLCPPPPSLTFVIVIVIIDPCKYQTSPSCSFDELQSTARQEMHVWGQHRMTIN